MGKHRGYTGLFFDLLNLCNALNGVLQIAEGHSDLREADLLGAEVLAEQFFHSAVMRHEPLRTRRQAAHQRDREFTLLCDAYNQVRRAVQYLYWRPGEVDRYIPSLYKRQRRRKTKQETLGIVAEPPVPTPGPRAPNAAANDAACESPFLAGSATSQDRLRAREEVV